LDSNWKGYGVATVAGIDTWPSIDCISHVNTPDLYLEAATNLKQQDKKDNWPFVTKDPL
jgi:hypothetical protein